MTRLSKETWQALSPLFDAALELEPQARAAWLRTQRESNPGLAAELEDLLKGEAVLEREGFLGGGEEPERPDITPSLAGRTLGPYVLERPLGQGGMGTVWLARRRDGRFEGAAAIKFLSLAVSGPAGEARFRREGSLLARLSHPNIARLLDAGVSPTGQPYLVLEHVDGAPLDAWCDERRLSADARLRLFQQVLAAVSHAHANLIVHRDLKPANILVTADGTVKLLDFGIAKLMEGTGEVTGTQDRLLTFEYASPEQIKSEPVSTASDVYSLGVVLYQLLAGRHPTSASCHTPAEHLKAILDTDPAQLSRAVTPSAAVSGDDARHAAAVRDSQPDRLRKTYAGDLDNILAKALRKDPAERYLSVTALADDLARYLDHRPVSARSPTLGYRSAKFLRRNRGAVASALLVTVALLSTTGFAAYQMVEARRQRDAALQGLRRQEAISIVRDVLASDSRGADGRLLTAEERLRLATDVLQGTFHREPWLVAEGMINLSATLGEMGDQVGRLRILTEAEALTRSANLPEQLAFAKCIQVDPRILVNQRDSARAGLAEAKATLATVRNPSIEIMVACMDAEGKLQLAENQADSAVLTLSRAVAITERGDLTGSFTALYRLQLLNDLATALRGAGQTRAASRYNDQIVRQLDSSGFTHTIQFPNAIGFLTSALTELGEFRLMESTLAPYIRKQEALQGQGQAAAQLGFLYGLGHLRLGQLDSAEFWIGQALKDTLTGAGTGGIAMWAPPAMTQLRLDQGNVAEARREIRNLPTGTLTRRANIALYGARIRWAEGDSVGALNALEPALKEMVGSAERPQPALALSIITAAEWRLASRSPSQADSLARLGIAAAAVDSLALRQSGWVGRAEMVRAQALAAMGNRPGAQAAADRAVAALSNGFGPDNRRTAAARALRGSLSP